MSARLRSDGAHSPVIRNRFIGVSAVILLDRLLTVHCEDRLFGFLLGSTIAGTAVYYYILEEYKVSNELLTEDIYALQAAVQRIHEHVQSMESKFDEAEKKRR